jgi:hypothetical protein
MMQHFSPKTFYGFCFSEESIMFQELAARNGGTAIASLDQLSLGSTAVRLDPVYWPDATPRPTGLDDWYSFATDARAQGLASEACCYIAAEYKVRTVEVALETKRLK